ncbi:VOC family protein [Streptomyces sp. A1-5]|uniref:VOC family protein n=1 Tax=Streptomyces sp. A1-5 TaxID=2738410 RepID=UPI001F247AC4|nr:VOC family protein [Streptomyces sp. A1-5]UJB39740.1 VOC family protein [Streptomyces sp. A1-5]
MRIHLTSVFVDDQEKAVRFYTDVLGFVKKNDVPLGEARWLTVVSPENPAGAELLLEPSDHSAVQPYMAAGVRVDCTTDIRTGQCMRVVGRGDGPKWRRGPPGREHRTR